MLICWNGMRRTWRTSEYCSRRLTSARFLSSSSTNLVMAARSCGGSRAAAAWNWAGEGRQRVMSTSHRRTPLSSTIPSQLRDQLNPAGFYSTTVAGGRGSLDYSAGGAGRHTPAHRPPSVESSMTLTG
uniref:Uncharacterized protein n=1 Tax=Arundo donax TaxID=35708 RepID=A0A0A9GQ60_ARUDO